MPSSRMLSPGPTQLSLAPLLDKLLVVHRKVFALRPPLQLLFVAQLVGNYFNTFGDELIISRLIRQLPQWITSHNSTGFPTTFSLFNRIDRCLSGFI